MAKPQARTIGHHRAGVEDQPVAEPSRGDREELPLLGEVGGEEDAEHDLADLDRLELERPDLDPQAGTLDVPADPGDQGQQQQEDPERQQQVAVAVQVPGPSHDGQCQHVDGHAAGRPRRLEGCVVRVVGVAGGDVAQGLVDTGDHHVAEPVQQEDDRHHHRVGVGHEHPVGQVGGGAQAEDDQEERRQVRGEFRRVAEDHQHVGGHDDRRGGHHEAQLRAAPGLEPAARPSVRRGSQGQDRHCGNPTGGHPGGGGTGERARRPHPPGRRRPGGTMGRR